MKQELQDELYAKYPEIFAQKDLPMTQTCMCWGIGAGDGWYQIIDDLCTKIQDHVVEIRKTHRKATIQAIQVKEKMGGLRFYLNYSDDYIENLREEATKKSYKTCDVCGAPGHCASYRRWWMTLCKEHSDEHIAKSGHKIEEIYYEDEDDDESNEDGDSSHSRELRASLHVEDDEGDGRLDDPYEDDTDSDKGPDDAETSK